MSTEKSSLTVVFNDLISHTYPDDEYHWETELNSLIWQSQLNLWNQVAQKHGWKNSNEVLDAVEARTTYKWVYFHSPVQFNDRDAEIEDPTRGSWPSVDDVVESQRYNG